MEENQTTIKYLNLKLQVQQHHWWVLRLNVAIRCGKSLSDKWSNGTEWCDMLPSQMTMIIMWVMCVWFLMIWVWICWEIGRFIVCSAMLCLWDYFFVLILHCYSSIYYCKAYITFKINLITDLAFFLNCCWLTTTIIKHPKSKKKKKVNQFIRKHKI